MITYLPHNTYGPVTKTIQQWRQCNSTKQNCTCNPYKLQNKSEQFELKSGSTRPLRASVMRSTNQSACRNKSGTASTVIRLHNAFSLVALMRTTKRTNWQSDKERQRTINMAISRWFASYKDDRNIQKSREFGCYKADKWSKIANQDVRLVLYIAKNRSTNCRGHCPYVRSWQVLHFKLTKFTT